MSAPLPATPTVAAPSWAADRVVTAFDILLELLETQNPDFLGHSLRVAEVAASTATVMGLSDAEVAQIRMAGRLHDLGMMAVPSAVLNRAGPLTTDEAALVRLHPQIGAQILAPIVDPAVVTMIRGHHERWDGRGYPDGLARTQIDQGARILAVAEVLDAMRSPRPYRGSLSDAAALAELNQLAGAAIDPVVAEAAIVAVKGRQDLRFLADQHPATVEVELCDEGKGSTIQRRLRWPGMPAEFEPERL